MSDTSINLNWLFKPYELEQHQKRNEKLYFTLDKIKFCDLIRAGSSLTNIKMDASDKLK